MSLLSAPSAPKTALSRGTIPAASKLDNKVSNSIPAITSTEDGPLHLPQVTERRGTYGPNTIASEKKNPWYMILLQSFFHPFNILLCIIATLSALADELSTTYIISVMVVVSTSIRFYQEVTSEGAVHGLLKLITKSVSVIRYDPVQPTPMEMTIPSNELVPGDWV